MLPGPFADLTASTVNPKNAKPSPMISKTCYDNVMKNAERLNSAIIYDRDFSYVSHKVRTEYEDGTAYAAMLHHTELLRLQDPRAIIPSPNQWQSGRETSASAHACCCWYSRRQC